MSVTQNLKGFFQGDERRTYWQTVPLSAIAWIGLSAFLAFTAVGLSTVDSGTSLRLPQWWALTRAAVVGGYTALFFIALLRRPRSRPLAAIVLVLLLIILRRIDTLFPASQWLAGPAFSSVRSRLATDGLLAGLAAVLGWITLVLFAGTQGIKHVRARTELELAEKLQQTLAPPLAVRNAAYEVRGKSAPSSQMGGDLLDCLEDRESIACYLADVSGHGIHAGVFMGMAKSSVRTALLRPGPLEQLLADLNRVLFEIKAGSPTYATFACVRCGEGGQIEYALAGHGPILHYQARTKNVAFLAMEQFPLGLFADAKFESRMARLEPGDILALLTDGLPEVADAKDEQFGLERIGGILAEYAEHLLDELIERLFEAARRHGRQNDDETLILVRATPSGRE
jgi:stage II sporulation SpoE-like protein